MMSEKRLILMVVLAVATLLVSTGCGSGSNKGDKNKASAQWKVARASVMVTLARDQFRVGNFDGARGTISEALNLLPESADLRILSGRIAIEQGNLELAEAELRRAQTADPKNAAADYYYGVVMQRWQRTARALELYTTASEKAPGELAYLLARAETMVAMDKESDALQLLTKASESFENSAEIRATIGQIYLRQRRYAEAADILRLAVMLSPTDNTLRDRLATASFKAGRFPEALDHLERLLRDDQYAKRADLHSLLGECHLAAERPRDARASFETAAELQPQNVTYQLNIARASLEAGDVRRCEIAVRRALALQPADPQANLLLGYVRMEQDKFSEALAAFRRAAQSDGKDPMPLTMSGLALEKLGRREEAAQAYAAALSLKPDDDLARRLLNQLTPVANIDPSK